LEEARSAVVQIRAQGSFVDPEVGLQQNVAGSGSGFIIDESGVAVTNNHVVTGAAFLEVYVAGEDEPRNARVLGVSECSDLAVIDIEGEGLPYLQWHEDPVDVGLEIYTAGFPLGDPEFTLTRGIISKANANGDSGWASVGAVVEHDATINPGNSGGPLIDSDARVVGINYAGNDSGQYFAIATPEALGVIDDLRAGQDVTSIGINGTAISDGDLSGIWVASVESGSPADLAGIEAGDVVTELEGLALGTDGTMSDYCNILRSRAPSDVMRVEVLRYSTGELLEGALNGDPLQAAPPISIPPPSTEAGPPADTYTYVEVRDETGQLRVDIPDTWTDQRLGAVTRDGAEVGIGISASPDVDAFLESWSTPGVQYFAYDPAQAPAGTVEEIVAQLSLASDCAETEADAYDDGVFVGWYELSAGCGPDQAATSVVVAATSPGGKVVTVTFVGTSAADGEALDRVLDTFNIDE
jgi:serine protease Do